MTPTVVQAAQEAIKKRELIKVRVLQNCMEEPEDVLNLVEGGDKQAVYDMLAD